ncbi:MAG: hypothetical protein ABIG69_17330 [Bacteroidota bacterium]
MEEENTSTPNDANNQKLNEVSKTEDNISKELISQRVKKYIKKFSKYILITIIGIIAIYFIAFFIKENSLKSLEASKYWTDSIPYFKINLTTSFRYNDVWADRGRLLYQIYLEADTNRFRYNTYDKSGKIIISFLDAQGFKIDQYDLSIGDFTRIINNKDEVIEFSRKDSWYVTIKDLRSYNSIDVSWNVSFEKK